MMKLKAGDKITLLTSIIVTCIWLIDGIHALTFPNVIIVIGALCYAWVGVKVLFNLNKEW